MRFQTPKFQSLRAGGLVPSSAWLKGKSPENIDKEIPPWVFKERCDPYNDAVLPEAPKELVSELSRRYILLFELITGSEFEFPAVEIKPEDELVEGVRKTLLSQ
ncbi:uncharacterized protein PITG_09532 [Phytophthora infestans T30-4]|uniref:phosphoribosylaminoimidazolesuccinocarboxamide synthase n=1 Tax=Phytophthora infestans (strain T30-4) TaxID=403677 RepID=D0NC78_PHYIT|nr:uncharacterized protein PITG_09532 [Phytophthora infestans T30-4]EEY55592.1 conserved hypothetical protein [Phytophthora infestans T30-4]|eukprot:XP_002903168.1 conserved hypothetical protein [Phytophthora infestans T30-4]